MFFPFGTVSSFHGSKREGTSRELLVRFGKVEQKDSVICCGYFFNSSRLLVEKETSWGPEVLWNIVPLTMPAACLAPCI